METLSALLTLCEGNTPLSGGFPSQRAGDAGVGDLFDVSQNQRLNEQTSGRWSETPGWIEYEFQIILGTCTIVFFSLHVSRQLTIVYGHHINSNYMYVDLMPHIIFRIIYMIEKWLPNNWMIDTFESIFRCLLWVTLYRNAAGSFPTLGLPLIFYSLM